MTWQLRQLQVLANISWESNECQLEINHHPNFTITVMTKNQVTIPNFIKKKEKRKREGNNP